MWTRNIVRVQGVQRFSRCPEQRIRPDETGMVSRRAGNSRAGNRQTAENGTGREGRHAVTAALIDCVATLPYDCGNSCGVVVAARLSRRDPGRPATNCSADRCSAWTKPGDRIEMLPDSTSPDSTPPDSAWRVERNSDAAIKAARDA